MLEKDDTSNYIKMYELALYTKKNHPEYYDRISSLLHFLHKTGKISQVNDVITNDIVRLYSIFVTNGDGIISLLDKMLHEADNQTLDKFFDAIDLYINFSNDNINEISCWEDVCASMYIINIYTMLKAYEKNKDDFITFSGIVDSVKDLLIPIPRSSVKMIFFEANSFVEPDLKRYGSPSLMLLKILINDIVGLIKYPKYTDMNTHLENVIREACCFYESGLYNQYRSMCAKVNELLGCTIYARIDDLRMSQETIDMIFKHIVKNSINAVEKVEDNPAIPVLTNDNTECYAYRILYQGKRFPYIIDKLFKIEHNSNIRREIMSHVSKINPLLFDRLNINKMDSLQAGEELEDEFIRCMDAVFDSDTYQEMFKKLQIIEQADEIFDIDDIFFSQSEVDKANSLLDKLFTDELKTRLEGEKLEFFGDIISKKPATMCERMLTLYSSYAKSDDFNNRMLKVQKDAESSNDVIKFLNSEFNGNINGKNDKKTKIKKLFNSGGDGESTYH